MTKTTPFIFFDPSVPARIESSGLVVRMVVVGVRPIAGRLQVFGHRDGVGAVAEFNRPYGWALDAAGGVLYLTDRHNHCVRAVTLTTGTVSTVAGVPVSDTHLTLPTKA